MYQPEYAAVLYILGAPTLWQRAAPHVRESTSTGRRCCTRPDDVRR